MDLAPIAKKFFSFDQLEKTVQIGNGHINDTYDVTSVSEGINQRYILQKINHQVFDHPEIIMENLDTIVAHFQSLGKGDQIVAPLRRLNDQEVFIDHQGAYWRAYQFIKNSEAVLHANRVEQAKEAAKAYGAFLVTLNKLPVDRLKYTINRFHDGLLRWEQFEEALEKGSKKRKAELQETIDFFKARRHILLEVQQKNFPKRLVHHDTKISNVLFQKHTNKALVVIDLDTVMPGILLSDFGDMVRSFSYPPPDPNDQRGPVINLSYFKAICEGFLSEVSGWITPLERNSLVLGAKWIVFMQALRFATDYLNGDIYYKIKYEKQNFDRTFQQVRLLKDLEEKESDMERIVKSSYI